MTTQIAQLGAHTAQSHMPHTASWQVRYTNTQPRQPTRLPPQVVCSAYCTLTAKWKDPHRESVTTAGDMYTADTRRTSDLLRWVPKCGTAPRGLAWPANYPHQ